MRKRISAVSAFLVVSAFFSGCSLNSDYSEENYDIIATYIAHSVIKHDKNLAYRLVDVEDEISDDVTPEDENTDKTEEDNNNEDNIVNEPVKDNPENNKADDNKSEEKNNTPIEKVLGLNDFKCEYDSYKMINSAGDGLSYTIQPAKGKIYCIVSIKITNISDKTQSIHLVPDGITYELDVDGNKYLPSISMIQNDILYYSNEIKKGKSVKAAIVFEIPDKECKNIKLNISSANGEYEYTIKK